MYKDCLTCPKLGISCDGANFLAMSAHDLLDWCKLRKNQLGLTNAALAEIADIPVGTINRLFSADMIDCKYETIRPVVKSLIGGWQKNHCLYSDNVKKNEHLNEELSKLQVENERLKIHIIESEKCHSEDILRQKQNIAMALQLFEKQLRFKNRAIVSLSLTVILFMICAIGIYIYDRSYLDRGWITTSDAELKVISIASMIFIIIVVIITTVTIALYMRDKIKQKTRSVTDE